MKVLFLALFLTNAFHGLFLGMTRDEIPRILRNHGLWQQSAVFDSNPIKKTVILNPKGKAKFLYKTGQVKAATLVFESDTLKMLMLFGIAQKSSIGNNQWAANLGSWCAEAVAAFDLSTEGVAEKAKEAIEQFERGSENDEKILLTEKSSTSGITSLYLLQKSSPGGKEISGLVIIRPLGSQPP